MHYRIIHRPNCLQYDKLFTKMRYIGFTDDTIKWFQDYLTNRQQVVDVDSTVSDQQPMQLGVPQGSILGPILFLIYVNDINNCIGCWSDTVQTR